MTRHHANPAGAWADVLQPIQPERRCKPRRTGVTAVLDKGLGLTQTRDLLETAGAYIDFLKFGFGTAALYDRDLLQAKLTLCRQWQVDTLPGGTFFEYAAAQGESEAWLQRVASLGFTTVEISDGSIDIAAADRASAIRIANALGLRVLTEVGRKDQARHVPASELRRQLEADLSCGAEYVTVEGRESGQGVGIYRADGTVTEDDFVTLLDGLPPPDLERLIWEAPRKDQQIWLLREFGCNVNLGNIAPADVLALEAQRQGLRGDTLPAALRAARSRSAPLGAAANSDVVE